MSDEGQWVRYASSRMRGCGMRAEDQFCEG